MEDDLQTGECSPLEPLVLPPGVTPEIAARLTTGILMRRAYCSTTPWTQWLLLASVRILHGHGTPTLDSVSLHLLQGSMNDKLSCGDLSVDIQDAIPHLDTEEIKDDFERENTSDDTALPCTKDHMDLGNALNVEPSPPSMETAAEEELSYLEKGKIAENTTISFTKDCIDAHANLESTFNVKSNLELSLNSMQSTISEDKNTEISFNPLKGSTPRTSLVPIPKNDLCENENSFNVSHHSPRDTSNIEHSQQRCSVSLVADKIPLQDASPLLAEHGPDKEQSSILMNQDHLKKHGLPEGDVSTELSNSDVMSSKTGNVPCCCASKLIKKSVCIQVNPRKLGILTTKWIQVKGPQLREVGVQVSPLNHEIEQAKDFDDQVAVSGCDDLLPKVFADKQMQTVVQNKRDKSSQTGESLWNIIPLSSGMNSASRKKDKMKSIGSDDNEKNASGDGIDSSNVEKSIAKEKKLFHGRPMAKGKMAEPVKIPLDGVVSMDDPRFQDPRLISN